MYEEDDALKVSKLTVAGRNVDLHASITVVWMIIGVRCCIADAILLLITSVVWLPDPSLEKDAETCLLLFCESTSFSNETGFILAKTVSGNSKGETAWFLTRFFANTALLQQFLVWWQLEGTKDLRKYPGLHAGGQYTTSSLGFYGATNSTLFFSMTLSVAGNLSVLQLSQAYVVLATNGVLTTMTINNIVTGVCILRQGTICV